MTTDLLRQMVRIRAIEETIADEYARQEMKTPMHLSIGQEAVAVGVCAALQDGDVVYSGHRSHAEYLAKGGSLQGLVSELYGRADGCSGGRGGSVHLTAPEVGYICSSAILGQTIPVAVGHALAFQMDQQPNVAVCFFGDGATEEGVFYESLHFAALKKLPVLFVCANNGLSTHARTAERPAVKHLTEVARHLGVAAYEEDGNSVNSIYATALWAAKECREGRGPILIEAHTLRWREHVGPNWDYPEFRTEAEVKDAMRDDPISRESGRLIDAREHGAAGMAADMMAWREQAVTETLAAIAHAKAAPYPSTDDLLVGAY